MIFKNEYVECSANVDGDVIHIQGRVVATKAEVFAANPIDRMVNYSGSGLPFPCAQIAFESTPNFVAVGSKNGTFSTTFKYPNSYYTEDQWTLVPPSIFFKIYPEGSYDPFYIRFALPKPEMLNVRTLNFRTNLRAGPNSYSVKEDIIPICGAEETMRRYKDLKIQKDLA